ncbi:hypothetical protein Cwoe_5460 [Conexibacter woesei DSM 14684]|uniref:Uncharacterized protein n=2 Tax=Conexibacter TaxID=191494 RepID=D3EZM7_CONWI|nr:hypothetical protein Cwoe_5460 [Conexibacter woesei DSM 14684]
MEIFDDTIWQMSLGERAAFEGVLTQLEPELAIEIGTAEGASLRRIAAHAKEVHSFDLVAPSLELPDHVTLHPGDSHVLLPELLAQLAADGRNVDFALVDGDHSSDGVQRDIEDLLDSDAVRRTLILIHDVNNEQVRRGVDAVRYRAWRKVAYVELDCVPGYMFKQPSLRHELWGGLGLIVVDDSRPATADPEVLQQRYYPAAPLWAEVRDTVVSREQGDETVPADELTAMNDRVALLERQLAEMEELVLRERHGRNALEQSISWKLTRPLRAAKARARRALA